MRKTLLPITALCLACQPPVDDVEPELDSQLEPRSGADPDDDNVWDPQPIDPQLCNDPEEEPSRAPDNGECEIEVRVRSTEFVTGQGISEGKGEISTLFTATTSNPPNTYGTRIPGTGELVYTVGETKHHGDILATYTVPVGGNLGVEVCATFTEHDNGGANGSDDVGSGCSMLSLECHPVQGQPTFAQSIGPETLCGPNQCNGSMAATVEVMRADADGDGVDNDDDFTPEPCDEVQKGDAGIALLQYFHYDDDAFTTLAQSAGSDLARPYPAYDYKVLLIDSDTSNPNMANSQAIRDADLVFPPTREGLLDAMQILTAKGYRFDALVHAHGYKDGTYDSSFEVLDGYNISGDWLVSATDPNLVGTARGGVPILAWWSTTCIAARQIDAWQTIGAKALSGAIDVQFFPTTFHNYVDNWIGGDPYRVAVDTSLTPGVIGASQGLIALQGAAPPYNCTGPTVLDAGACAVDFFHDDIGPNEAAYDISEVYDHTATGAENMLISSTRDFLGNDALVFGGAAMSWP